MSYEQGSPVPGAADTGSVSERSAQRAAIGTPRTPRQWNAGSEEPPADVTRLRGASGEDDVVRCGTGWWIVAPGEDPVVPNSFADGFRWRAGASIPTRLWPLSEVLPETPEPPQAQTDRDQLHQNVRFAIADPGHFLPRVDGEPVSHWSARAVMDVLGMLGMLGAPGEGYTVRASQSVPAVPVSSTGGKETGEGNEDAQGAAEVDWTEEPRFADFREAYDYATSHFSTAIRAHAKVDRREAYLPGDQVPVGTVLTSKNGSPFRVPDAHTSEGLARVGVPFVEVLVPSPEEWQAIVDRARDARAIPEPTEGQNHG